ncbi:MAG TPA: NAD(P)-binding protein [Candidatus Manganitrophaceae bacterium]|nr:NAD(P)-binding protein [Candidatus Manganitrophaceae bacterium]
MVRKSDSKIKIAGAGPSGLAAAIRLARAGFPVELFEARDMVGARFIGDFQVIENMSRPEDALEMLKRFGLETSFFIRPVREAVFFDHRLRPQPVRSLRPFGYFIRRGREEGTLDRGLLAQALAAGVEVHFQKRIRPEEADRDGAPPVIVATGPPVADGLAKEMTFHAPLPDTVWVIFDMNLSPGGYTYLFVLGGFATFGCAITRDFSRIDEYFDRSLRRFQEMASFTVENEKRGYSFMNFCLKESAQAGRRLFVGEAGGFQDYLFGLGLRYALTTGFLAAESLIRDEPYDRLWKQEIGPTQETSLVNRFLYEWGGNEGLAAFIRRAGRGDLREYLARWSADRPWKRWMVPMIKWGWGDRKPSTRPPYPHWRRKRPTEPHPDLGPVNR